MQKIYLSSIAHDLKTPLNSILNTNQYLMLTLKNDKQVLEFLEINNSSCEHLLYLIKDITDLSKLEMDQFHLQNEYFNLEQEINSILKIMKHQAQLKNIQIEFRKVDMEFDQIFSDPHRLNNSIKFTQEGSIQIIVKNNGIINDQNEHEIEFKVIDSGIGIKQSDIPKLFKLFSRLRCHNGVNQQGVGLGLSISKQLTEKLGGTINVQSIYRKGSVFNFTIKAKCQFIQANYNSDNQIEFGSLQKQISLNHHLFEPMENQK